MDHYQAVCLGFCILLHDLSKKIFKSFKIILINDRKHQSLLVLCVLHIFDFCRQKVINFVMVNLWLEKYKEERTPG